MKEHNTSIGAIWASIHESINVLHEHLVPEYVRLPTTQQAAGEAELFNEDPVFMDKFYAALVFSFQTIPQR